MERHDAASNSMQCDWMDEARRLVQDRLTGPLLFLLRSRKLRRSRDPLTISQVSDAVR